jgi:hypothetical protein
MSVSLSVTHIHFKLVAIIIDEVAHFRKVELSLDKCHLCSCAID